MAASQRILVIDDDPQFCASIEAALVEEGFEVVTVGTGAAGTDALDQTISLVVVDGLLPDAQGVEWIIEARRLFPSLPMVFVSGFLSDLSSYVTLTSDLSVAAVLYKPVPPDQIVSAIRRALGQEAARKDGRSSRLKRVRSQLATKLPGRVASLRARVEALRTDTDLKTALSAAIVEAHNLRGTAASFGFARVGDAAGSIEDALRAASSGELPWPLLKAALAGAEAHVCQAPESSELHAQTSESLYRLLVVDDDPDFIRGLAELAGPSLVSIVPAADHDSALDLASRHPPDAVLVDVSIPGTDTFELARQLRAQEGQERLPIGFISGNDTILNRTEAALSGASLFVAKPIDASEFEQALQQLLRERDQERSRVLIVDDDVLLAQGIADFLRRRGHHVDVLHEPSRVIETINRFSPHAMLLDATMPVFSGYDVCRAIRLSARWRALPILFVTADSSDKARHAAFAAGGDDYLQKPVHLPELCSRLEVRLERARLLADRSERDPVSGLLSRQGFSDRFHARLSEAARKGDQIALCLIDLDRFKRVNDEHGHNAGDRVLSALGLLLRRRLRPYDLRARWGGEEFLFALPGEDAQTAAEIARRTLAEFGQLSFEGDSGTSFNVTFSAGIAAYPADGRGLTELVAAADVRLYRAKDAGRNRVIGPDVEPTP